MAKNSSGSEGIESVLPKVSLVFPLYKDEGTVETVVQKGLEVLSRVASEYEVVIVNDGSPDRSGEIADELAAKHPEVVVVHHDTNLGYGAAVQSAFERARHDWICQTDGDDEYDVADLERLLALRHHYDLVITFRYVKLYSNLRIGMSWIYNKLVRLVFRTPYRDISTGLRLIRRSTLETIGLVSSSPFIGAELAIKTMLKGSPVGEMGIQTFPREFGRGSSVSPKNILSTLRDLWKVRRQVFSPDYCLPRGRER